MNFQDDIEYAKTALSHLHTHWDGKTSILEMKAANYNWRQMEWWGFYFELLCRGKLQKDFQIPGDKYGSAVTSCFDLKRTINWDLKAKAIKSDDHRSILNDQVAMDNSVKQYGAHGLIIALCDVEYNDHDRSFQKWHSELKGGKSKYEVEREQRTSVSRYRKTKIDLQEILFLIVDERNLALLGTHNQGRNSNGRARPPKYMLDYDEIENFLVDRIKFHI
jgi:hypothetical protein